MFGHRQGCYMQHQVLCADVDRASTGENLNVSHRTGIGGGTMQRFGFGEPCEG